MSADVFYITGKVRGQGVRLASRSDFELRETSCRPAQEVLSNPAISLYCFDLERRAAIFVEGADQSQLSRAPFAYLAQYEHAARLWTVDLETFIELGRGVADDGALVMVHSVGRCGSTLASQLVAQIDGIVNWSEPDALAWLVAARHYRPENSAFQKGLLRATIAMLRKSAPYATAVIKGRSFCIELADWVQEIYPRARHVFLYRDAASWLSSCQQTFGTTAEIRDEAELARIEQQVRHAMTPLVSLLAAANPDEALGLTSVYCLMWLSTMERYLDLHERNPESRAISYESWLEAPSATADLFLKCCGLQGRISDTHKELVLARDSQAGTALARRGGASPPAQLAPDDAAILRKLLTSRPTVREEWFRAPGTLSPSPRSDRRH